MYRHLNETRILSTLSTLALRIEERFPGSGLGRVAQELISIAEETQRNMEFLRRPFWPIRIAAIVSILVMLLLLGVAISVVIERLQALSATLGGGIFDILQGTEALVNEIVFLGIAIWFVLSLETRLKRRRALGAIHELRSIAHIVDMHQLTKDPARMLSVQADTASSPVRNMTREQLGRYLDYCSELLSVTSKLAALYVQNFNDPVVLDTVSEVETLASGLSSKIWQKITLLDSTRTAAAETM
jgi:hypothetical protein